MIIRPAALRLAIFLFVYLYAKRILVVCIFVINRYIFSFLFFVFTVCYVPSFFLIAKL